MSSPQPQPIDDIAGVRAVPWDDSPPRAVQVVFRHRAIDLMPLLCRKRQERRCNPPVLTSAPFKGIASVQTGPDGKSTKVAYTEHVVEGLRLLVNASREGRFFYSAWTHELLYTFIKVLAIQQETQDFKTFGKTANSDQDLNMTR